MTTALYFTIMVIVVVVLWIAISISSHLDTLNGYFWDDWETGSKTIDRIIKR